jgi:hypothetical protein
MYSCLQIFELQNFSQGLQACGYFETYSFEL